MLLMRILPGVLKELSKHVPTVLFQTVEWSELASELPKISRRIIQKEGFDELFERQRALLNPHNILLTSEHISSGSIHGNKWAGEKLLTLYFTQIFSPHGVFIDLRTTHFEPSDSVLKWHPNGLWTVFEESFRHGLLDVYEGFYCENEQLYFEGLEKIGLLRSDFSLEDKKRLGDLFKAQFGSALEEEMNFNLEHLRDSIIKMSEFMLNKKVKISKDFLYLGIYLVTMYSALEQTGEKLPVKQIYLDVRNRFTAKELS